MTAEADADERRARAALTRVIEPGDENGGRWLREYGARGLMQLLTAPEGTDDRALGGVGPRRVSGLRARAAAAAPERDLSVVAGIGGRFVCPGDREWPTQLDDLGTSRPIGLWVRGTPDLRLWALRSVAVVGARACTPYGAHMAATMASGLAERGWVVASGAAYGVDGAAHRGALASDGATIAVLACGVDVVYPPGHAELVRRIAEQGLVVGELAPGDHPTRSRFILRNRVIAALTRGTVVVEAEYRSGSLVTARCAQRLGRFTMGVPGPATSGLSAGVHEMLRNEGVLVTDAAEVVELVGDMGDLAPARRGPVLGRDLLDPPARRILEALPGRGALGGRDIAREAATTVDEALGRLYELHSLGFVERHGDGWQLTPRTTRDDGTRRAGP
ncbi:DNA-processing protein DprA [Streptomyces sp. NBC_01498]|uniref:DNA-processing protein DprA n=1 Tax=Streptomyces sp. NBC_01498 TaxID=2975870 RepID=UPI002E7B3202|nr:DNA-processing protein DprA [Streptomyces sp. NBC_01498]WTL24387.1 DNA-processing protein DprA [Streptomyces sp. NBC_01498]